MNKTILKHNLVQMDSRDLIKYIQKEFPTQANLTQNKTQISNPEIT